MYLFEWMLWWVSTFDEKQRDKDWLQSVEERQVGMREMIEEVPPPLDMPASDNPRTRGPVFAINDTFLEMRCGSLDHYRGLATPLILATLAFAFFGLYMTLGMIIRGPGHNSLFEYVFALLVIGGLTGGMLFSFFKFKLYIPVRWELFTQRRLLIRFNRKTRQVHLHRPKNTGGITTVAWEDTVAVPERAGMRLLLLWPPHKTGEPFMTFAAVGKRAGSSQELIDEWEFIRRYMEEGLESVPEPRVRSRIPWPWYSLEPQFEGLGPILRNGGWQMWLGKLLISPAFLTLGGGHWLSQLLCWEPRWPKIIREAGQPGKPVPKLTTAEDYGPETCRRLHLNQDMWIPREIQEDEIVNINAADESELAKLDGIGSIRAKAIVAYREEHGPFDALERLENVPGISTKQVRQNRWRMRLD